MTYAQLKTESGTIYQFNVVDKKFRRIQKSGDASAWVDYKGMFCAGVGSQIHVTLADDRNLSSTLVTELSFPKSEEK